MLPSVVAREVIEAVRQQLHAQYPSTTAGFLRDDALEGVRAAIDDLLEEPRQVFRGPYLNIGLPFQAASSEEVLPFTHLTFDAVIYRPYRHQMKAFTRLCGGAAQPTLVATGTGSGKTECFLYPLLEHCAENSVPGIKALVIYPMNALAKDQARRFAEEVHKQKGLKGKVRVGLYTGEAGRGTRSMGEFEVITDRNTLQSNPPDILLTNYKMLDFLLIRPRDRQLWRHNTPGMLRYLVVDELHTFDGAQGSDLACLIRRLRDRLDCGEELACVGTSATVGDDAAALTGYASDVFATPFGADSVLREERESLNEFLQGEVQPLWPDRDSVQAFSRQRPVEVPPYLDAASELWLGKPLPDVQDIGKELMTLAPFRSLLTQAVEVSELATLIGEHAQRWRVPATDAANAVDALVALACAARSGERPWLTVRVQLWLRELRRMVATVSKAPMLHFHADLEEELVGDATEDSSRTIVLPVVHCNECHATGWLARKRGASAKLDREPLPIYESFFGGRPDAAVLYSASAPPEARKYQARRICTHCGTLSAMPKNEDPSTPKAGGCSECGEPDAVFVNVVLPEMNREVERQGVKRIEFKRDCPYCEAQGSLLILGARAASLSSVAIGQLQQSPFNGDQKLIAFSDSVQDAAHRAGFFAARTYSSVIRHALATMVRHSPSGTLAELLDNFGPFWRNHLSKPSLMPKASLDADFVATFLAPDQYWRQDWEELKATDRLAPTSDLVSNYVLPRLRWEALVAFGFQSRRGRTLERTEVAVVHPDAARIEQAIEWAHPRIIGQLAELAFLDTRVLHQLINGVLWTMRTRGAFHDDMLDGFLHSKGTPFNLTNRRLRTHLKPLGSQSRVPHFVSLQHVGPHVDAVEASRLQSWYRRWFDKLAAQDDVMASASLSPFYRLLFDGMTRSGLLHSHDIQQYTVWSLDTRAWWVSTDVVTLACSDCRHRVQIASDDVADWEGMPCLRASCHGVHTLQPRQAGGFELVSGSSDHIVTPVRVNSAEHTAVLDSETRNATELSFKRNPPESWDINLLSATPTMEMGVDIGDLSSVLLCSVPPAQANYLQRIGRAGRKDGNAFNLTIASGQPHDLYHFAEPLEMMRGAVQPPGVFLGAIAVLERQLVAFCFDRWVQTGIEENAIPAQLRTVLDAVDVGSATIFPNNFFEFVEGERSRILRDFLNIFEAHISRSGENELSDFVQGAYTSDGSRPGLVRRLKDLFEDQSDQRRRFSREITKLKSDLDRTRKQPVDEAQKTAEAEISAELSALRNLLSRLNRQNTLQFLTDQGILPNYAFPEDGVTLKSVIYRRIRSAETSDGTKYQNIELEVRRPAQVALKELAPFSRFYGNTRSVQIDQVTIGRHDVELWRLCPSCNHGESIQQGDTHEVCPRCSHAGWRAAEQRMELMRLREVHARASDSESRIGDDSDDREPVFFNRQFLFDVDPNKIERGWRFTDENCPFGFEYLSRATFREVNFGRAIDGGSVVPIAGHACNRPGFPICADCGKVAIRRPRGQSQHARRCRWFDLDGEPAELAAWKQLHLFRELNSEAVRLLLPIADIARSSLRLESFTAALYLGLREHFGGNVDHLQIKAIDEPVIGSELRRYYLVLFDSVPGGTGYLADLLSTPDSLRAMLETSKGVLDACSCQHDGERDGCYRCLLAYKSSFQQADIKRSSALETLDLILNGWESLQALVDGDTLDHTKVNRFFDSELERRFIEVLANNPGCSMDRREVNGKDGFELTVRRAGVNAQTRASLRWSIEPQVDLGERDGVAVQCRPDFLFRCLSTRDGEARPIAVFVDGFEYHADIQADDTAKRYAILRSGAYRVWTLGWRDLPSDDERREPELDAWFSQPRDRLMIDKLFDPAAAALGLGAFAIQPHETKARVFKQWLHILADPIASEREYTTWAISRAFGLLDSEASRTPAPLRQQIGTWLPSAWQDLYLDGELLLGHREFEGIPLVDAVVSLPKSALGTLTETVRAAKSQPVGTRDPMSPMEASSELSEVAESRIAADSRKASVHPLAHLPLSVVLRLDDTNPSGDDFQLQWRRFWAAVNLLQYLPELMPVSRSGIERQVYAPIIEDNESLSTSLIAQPDSRIDRSWQAMIEFTVAPEALSELARRNIDPPDDVGIDVEEEGVVLGALEWCWTASQVGLVLGGNEDDAKTLRSNGWHIVSDVETASLDAIVNWLKGKKANE